MRKAHVRRLLRLENISPKGFDELARDQTRRAGPNGTAIDPRHGHHLSPGAGEEAFVGDVEVVLLQGLLDARNLQLLAEVEHDTAG